MFHQEPDALILMWKNNAPIFSFLFYLGSGSEAKKYQYWKGHKQSLIIKPFLKETCITFIGEQHNPLGLLCQRETQIKEHFKKGVLTRGSKILLSVLHLLFEPQGQKIINTTQKNLGDKQN